MKIRLTIIISSIIIASYLVWGRYNINSDLDKQVAYAKEVYHSERINLSKKHTILIEESSFFDKFDTNRFHVYLECSKTDAMRGDNYWDKSYSLKLKISAFATTDNNITSNRLVTNYFYPTDEPMQSNDKLWAGWQDDHMEYSLGEILVFPKENTFIELDVLAPDFFLNKANPRLKIVANYDRALLGPYFYLKMLRDGGLLLSLICLWYLVVSGQNTRKRR